MRTRTTLLMLVLAALIGAAVMNADKLMPSTRDLEAQRENPLPFDSAKVDAIEIEMADATVSLKVRDHLWRVQKPFDDMADPDRVTALLESLHAAEWLEKLDHSDKQSPSWKMTGLDKPFATVRLISAGKDVAECRVGNASAIDGACYVDVPANKKGERDAFVVHTELLNVLKKPADSWRDEKLLRIPAESVSRIVLDGGHGQIELARTKPKAPWDLVKPLQTRGHNERINELLAAVLALKISAVAPTDGLKIASPSDLLKIYVHTPAFAQPVELALLAPADIKAGHTQASASQRGHTYTIASDRLASLWVQLNDLRDDHLARVDVSKVDAIAVRSDQTADVVLRRESDHWLLNRHSEWEPANGDRVAKVFAALNEQRVKEFVADSSANLEPYGLQKPFLTVAWSETGATQPATAAPAPAGKKFDATPEITTETALMFGQDKDGNVYAKYESEPFVYRVSALVLTALPRDNVRWKALNPVRFTQFALRKIAITIGTQPTAVLDYDPSNAEWHGTRAGEDFSANIDRVKADTLAGKLGTLVVDDWVQDRTDGIKALQTPAITIQITLLTEAGNIKSPTKLLTLNFAPTVGGTDTALYFGRVDEAPDVFMITRSTLMELVRSVLKDAN